MTTTLRSARNNPVVATVAAGLLSGLLYLTYALSFGFLVPVQYAFARRDWKSGALASVVSIVVIAVGQIGRTVQVGEPVMAYLWAGILPPFALLVAIAAVNLRKGRISTGYRILISGAVLSVAASPFLLKALADTSFLAWLVKAVSEAMSITGADAAAVNSIAEQSVAQAVKVLSYGFSMFILSLLGVSWWWGSRLAAKSRRSSAALRIAEDDAPDETDLSHFKLPNVFLWLTLAAWAGVLATLAFKTEGAAAAVIWNVALCLTACFAVQGLGIVAYFATTRWNVPRALRAGLAMLVVLGIFVPVVGLVLVIALPLLGITETWVPYRTLKGARA